MWASMGIGFSIAYRTTFRHGGVVEQKFFPRVEALRGLAAASVVALHAGQQGWINASGEREAGLILKADRSGDWGWLASAYETLAAGYAGVNLFFVISGFVLYLSLQRGPVEPLAATYRFFVARIARLYPAMIVMVPIYVACEHFVWGKTYDVSTVVGQMLLLNHRVNELTWTLQMEMLAAPIILVLFLASKRKSGAVLVAAVALGAWLSFNDAWGLTVQPNGPPLYAMYLFIVGMTVPMAAKMVSTPRASDVCILFGASLLLVPRPIGVDYFWANMTDAAGAFLVVVAAAYGPPTAITRLLGHPWLLALGAISYSIYLWHLIPQMIVTSAGAPIAGYMLYVGIPPGAVASVAFVVILGVTIPISWLSYQFVERPGILLGRAAMTPARGSRSNPLC